jgi:hypothetical protein
MSGLSGNAIVKRDRDLEHRPVLYVTCPFY